MPSTIFKFESFSTQALLNLKAQSVYFGSPRNFNDPYDCAIRATVAIPSSGELERIRQFHLNDPSATDEVKNSFRGASPGDLLKMIVAASNEGLNRSREDFLDTMGVTCFSERNDDLLMWAHYGGQYKGFCLEFRTDIAPFSGIRPVEYVDVMPKVDVIQTVLRGDFDSVLTKLFCTKSSSWAYEQEWRAVHSTAGSLYTYPHEALAAVYFGPDIESHALEIVCLILNGQNSGVEFYRGQRSEMEFRVEFVPFTYTSFESANGKSV